MSEFVFPVRVYYEDTDLAGIVYHANYIKFYERSRTEMVRLMGLDQRLLIEQGLAFAVVHIDISYLKSARFNDALEVVTRIDKLGRASMVFEQFIRIAGDPSQILNKAQVKVACVTVADMKPAALPPELLKELHA